MGNRVKALCTKWPEMKDKTLSEANNSKKLALQKPQTWSRIIYQDNLVA